MITTDPGAWRRAFRSLDQTLNRAVSQRSKRNEIVRIGQFPHMAWELYERDVMLNAVNNIRAKHHLPLVTSEDIALLDDTASGHVDWQDKFTAACASLAVGQDPLL